MTAPRTLQRRRVASPDGVPPAVSRWFAGGPLCWEALLEAEKVPGWWSNWKREHPGSDHPAGAAWVTWD